MKKISIIAVAAAFATASGFAAITGFSSEAAVKPGQTITINGKTGVTAAKTTTADTPIKTRWGW